MTTPNVEELITYLQGLANEIEIPYPMEVIEEAAEVLQSQAERIAELERESETHSKAYGLAIVERDNLRYELKVAQEGWRCECSTDDACRFARERDALRSQLAALRGQEPVGMRWRTQLFPVGGKPFFSLKGWVYEPYSAYKVEMAGVCKGDDCVRAETTVEPLYALAAPVAPAQPAQGVTELVDALEMIVSTHQGHCEHHVGVSKHSYNLADIAEEALSKYKGAK